LTINEILKNKVSNIEYWDFADSKLSGLHKISSYPATMVPTMQKELIESIIESDSTIKNIFDPFHGSGVTLVEGLKLGLIPYGFDINPLANLITLVKIQGIDKETIDIKVLKITNLLLDENFSYSSHSFNKIDKWFRIDIQDSLSKIKCAIEMESNKYIRQYYWVCLINLIKKYSNTRSTTFKLHIKSKEDILKIQNNIIRDFIININKFHIHLPQYNKNKEINLFIEDTKNIFEKLEPNSIDLICTSPPYGDNATTVTYGQFSMLPLLWINKKDLSFFNEELLENYSSIDSASLGGTRGEVGDFCYTNSVFRKYIKTINVSKRKKVEKFISDYLIVCEKLKDVLKVEKCIVLTLGNRRVDNKIVPLTEITKEYFLKQNFILEAEFSRKIPVKRMPKRVSNVNDCAVESMNTEYIIIMKKKG